MVINQQKTIKETKKTWGRNEAGPVQQSGQIEITVKEFTFSIFHLVACLPRMQSSTFLRYSTCSSNIYEGLLLGLKISQIQFATNLSSCIHVPLGIFSSCSHRYFLLVKNKHVFFKLVQEHGAKCRLSIQTEGVTIKSLNRVSTFSDRDWEGCSLRSKAWNQSSWLS